MGSNSKVVREKQKNDFEAQLAARKEKLAKLGLTDAQQAADKIVLHLQSDIKRTARAIASIEKLTKTVADARQKKIENAAKAAEPKKKKAAPVKEEKKEKKAKKADKAEKAEKPAKA